MTKIGKGLAAVLLAAAMIVTFIPVFWTQTAYAEDEYPDVQNVNIGEDGVMTWDAVSGADRYVVMIDSGFLFVDSPEFDLKDHIDGAIEEGNMENTGSYEIRLSALNGSETLATWSGTYTYTSPYHPITIGTIDNVVISGGLLTWDAYPEADHYWIGIDGIWVPVDQGYDLDSKIDSMIADGKTINNGSHDIDIYAYNVRGTVIAQWSGTYSYTSTVVPVVLEGIENARIASGVLTWDAYPGAAEYWVHVNGASRPADPSGYMLNERIDTMISYEGLIKSGTYQVRIEALDSDKNLIAYWQTDYEYDSPAEPIEKGVLSNVKNTNGVLTWDAYPGAYEYWVGINGGWTNTKDPKFSLYTEINRLFLAGINPESGTYTYAIEARDAKHNTIANWEGGEYTYTVSIPMNDTEVSDVWDTLYTGTPVSFIPVVRYIGSYDAVEGTDYTWKYTDKDGKEISAPVNAGTYYMVFTGKGKPASYYTGTKKVAFKIQPIKVDPKASLAKTMYVYNGKYQKPVPKVSGSYVNGTDYTIIYRNNKKVGKATATVKMKGNYTGSTSVTFTIKPKKAVISKAVPEKKQVKVTMKTKVSATGGSTYQIKYRVKGASKWKTTATTARTKTIKKLKKGKRYQIKVRAYKKVNGTTYYGVWSKVKTVTTKK